MPCTVGESFGLMLFQGFAGGKVGCGRKDLAVLVYRLAENFSLLQWCPMSPLLPALFPCTEFGFEAGAAKLGLRVEIFTLKPLVFLGLWV